MKILEYNEKYLNYLKKNIKIKKNEFFTKFIQ